jgi:hypothetical protein
MMKLEYQNCLLRFDVLTVVVMNGSIFLDMKPYTPSKVNRRSGQTCRFHLQGRNQRERRWQAEQLVGFQRTTRRYITEGRTLVNVPDLCYLFNIRPNFKTPHLNK